MSDSGQWRGIVTRAFDLKPFCSTELSRSHIHSPFVYGEHTYATDGGILIRVARVAGDAPNEIGKPSQPRCDKILSDAHHGATFSPLGLIKLPIHERSGCPDCDGRATEHDCPDCDCTCDRCDGTGTVRARQSVAIAGVVFDCRYVALIAGLPGAELAVHSNASPFRFAGGVGVVAPLSGPFVDHLGDIAKYRSDP